MTLSPRHLRKFSNINRYGRSVKRWRKKFVCYGRAGLRRGWRVIESATGRNRKRRRIDGGQGHRAAAEMNFSAPFIKRPIATSLLTAAVLLAGAVAYRFLPVAPLPQVEFPTISVQASLPGASPETMASSVATPLERQFGRIAGVTEMTSSSIAGNDLDHAAIRPESQYRCGRSRRSGGHQRRSRTVAREPAESPDL